MPATTEEEVLSGILPQATIDKIVLESSGQNTSITEDDKTLKVTLHITIKEILDDNLLGSWFDSINFKKYVTIDVVQSIDSRVTDALSYSNDIINICKKFYSGDRLDAQDLQTRAFGFITNNTKLSEIYRTLNSKTRLRQISLTDANSNNITEYPSYLNSEGQRVYEIPFTISFLLDTLNPEHLSYFVVTSLDIKQICVDNLIDYATIQNEIEETGRVYSEIVIDNFNTFNQSYVYTDQNNVIWYGPVHQTRQGIFKSGNEETAGSITLNRVVVQNSKIQDFRNFEEIQKRIFDFTNITNFGINSTTAFVSLQSELDKLTKIEGANYKVDKYPAKFTNLFISRDFENNIKFLFGIDFKNVIKENSKFGSLVNNSSTLNQFLRHVKILDLKLFRRRIKNNFKINNSLAAYEYEKFNEEEPDDLIFQTNDNKNTEQIEFLSLNNDACSVREVNLALSEPQPHMRYFTGVDKTLSKISDGLYQYYIEFEIEDKIIEFLNNQLVILEESKNLITEYYNQVSTPTMRSFYINTQDPHIDFPDEYSPTPDLMDYGYDILSNKFSPQLTTRMRTHFNDVQPWEQAPSIFVQVLSIFSQNSNQQNNTILLNALTNFLTPETANPSSILKTIEIFDLLISTISKLIGNSVDNYNLYVLNRLFEISGTEESLFKDSLSISETAENLNNSNKNKTFKIIKYFNNTTEIVNTNLAKSYGIEYLNASFENNTDGLSYLTYEQFYTRISSEMLKFFNNESPNLPLVTKNARFTNEDVKYSFLSPVRLDFLNNSIVTIPTNTTIQSGNRTIEYFYGNSSIFELATLMQTDILNFKLDVSGKNRYRTTYKGSGVVETSIKTKTTKKINDLLGDFANITIQVETTSQNSATTNSFKELTNGIIYANEKSILGFMNSLSAGPLRSRDSHSNTSNTNRQNYIENIASQRTTDYIKNISQIRILISSLTKNSLPTPFDEENINNIPYQIRGLISNFRNETNERIRDYSNYTDIDYKTYIQNNVVNYFNHEMLVKIEYLSGFERDQSGNIIANSEIWNQLDKSVLDSFIDGRELLCRIRPYESSAFYPQPNLDVQNNSYNKYFILKTSQIIQPAPRLPPPPIVGITDFINIDIPNIPESRWPINNNPVDPRRLRPRNSELGALNRISATNLGTSLANRGISINIGSNPRNNR